MRSFILIIILLIVQFSYSNVQEKPENKKVAKSATLPIKTRINSSALLQTIQDNIKKGFPEAKIINANKNEAKGVITYSVQVKINDSKWSLIYDSKGKYIKKEEIKPRVVKAPDTKI